MVKLAMQGCRYDPDAKTIRPPDLLRLSVLAEFRYNARLSCLSICMGPRTKKTVLFAMWDFLSFKSLCHQVDMA